MFEFEAGVRQADLPRFDSVGTDLESFLEAKIRRRCQTVWQEHCSECAMPDCYSRCSFYSPRADYKCRRFPDGVSILPPTATAAAPMLVKFGRWARLLGYGPTPLNVPQLAARKERRALQIAQLISYPSLLRGIMAPVRRRIVNNRSKLGSWEDAKIKDLYFVVEAINDGDTPITLSINCKVLDVDSAAGTYFRGTLTFECGYDVKVLPVGYFVSEEFVGRKFAMELAAANDEDMPRIAFGIIDIVELDRPPRTNLVIQDPITVATSARPKVKCVVWDLDNTLWEGVLIEDGLEKLRLRPEVVRAIEALDRKGILQSVASKNSAEEALKALMHFGLIEYFLHPQISWAPKSASISIIRERLNVGIDTFVFVDDNEFERCEVVSQHPEVMVLDIDELNQFDKNERFDVEVTAESIGRRKLYQQESERSAALSAAPGDYEDFLKSCELHMEIADLTEADTKRASELAQRTNQLNIGTSRYTIEQLHNMLDQGSRKRAFIIRAADRFGNYGLIGLCVLDEQVTTIIDLMFSCRIQSKLIDDAFVAWLGKQYEGRSTLRARFNPTRKNSPAKDLLKRTGFSFEVVGEDGEVWVRRDTPRSLEDLEKIVHIAVSVR